jgi:ABC-type transporter Mla MlaB component
LHKSSDLPDNEEKDMRWTLEQKSEEAVTLRLEGPLTLEHAGELRSALREGMSGARAVTIELAEQVEADLSCLQLFCAAHRSALANRKKLHLRKGVPESFLILVESAGFIRHQGCTLNPYQDCLWIGGNLS